MLASVSSPRTSYIDLWNLEFARSSRKYHNRATEPVVGKSELSSRADCSIILTVAVIAHIEGMYREVTGNRHTDIHESVYFAIAPV